MQKWKLINTKKHKATPTVEALCDEYDLEKEIFTPLLIRRGVEGKADIERYFGSNIDYLRSPLDLIDIEKGVREIYKSIKLGEKIRVIGDYDVDGITATTTLVKGITFLGGTIDHDIPIRSVDGYGMSVRQVEKAKEEGVQLIITCDNGIAQFDACSRAKELGIKVVITDHHEEQFSLDGQGNKHYTMPDALAVIDPKRHDSKTEFKEICGCYVAYKVIETLILYGMEEDESIDIDIEELELLKRELLQLSAFATVSDVMPLIDENRIVVKVGMRLMETTKMKGLWALLNATNLLGKTLTTGSIGYQLAPCINACGRIDKAERGYKLLNAESETEARDIATEVVILNNQRKDHTETGVREASKILDNDVSYKNDKVLVLKLNNCPDSVLGIVAGKIKEKYHKPTIVFMQEGNILKGSGRSISTYNMFDSLLEVKYLFGDNKVGGHKMASGMSIGVENFDNLRKELNARAKFDGVADTEDTTEPLEIDLMIEPHKLTFGVVNKILKLEPLGNGNPEPLFVCKGLTLIKRKTFPSGKVAKYTFATSDDVYVEFTQFSGIDDLEKYLISKYGVTKTLNAFGGEDDTVTLDIVYTVGVNEFQGTRSAQYYIQNYR